MKEAK